jgi:hypothetical protein
MNTRTYTPSHPIVFIFDYTNSHVDLPHFQEEKLVEQSRTAVYIRTIADVDGDVTVTLVHPQNDDSAPGVEVFTGVIEVPGSKVAVVTSDNEKLLEIDLSRTVAEIRICVDDVSFPTQIWVEAA